jgi:hypothetical protein
MSITKILSEKDTPAVEKLERVAEIIAKARDNYQNGDAKLPCPDCNTAHGAMAFNMLDDDAKVELLKGEVGRIKAAAVEYARNNDGANLNKKIEELLATNGYFCNLGCGTKFEYI